MNRLQRATSDFWRTASALLIGLVASTASAQGLRIDIILVSEAMRGQVQACVIDKLPRKNERPSDHAPVVVDLA